MIHPYQMNHMVLFLKVGYLNRFHDQVGDSGVAMSATVELFITEGSSRLTQTSVWSLLECGALWIQHLMEQSKIGFGIPI